MMLETVFLRSSRFIWRTNRGLGKSGWTRRQPEVFRLKRRRASFWITVTTALREEFAGYEIGKFRVAFPDDLKPVPCFSRLHRKRTISMKDADQLLYRYSIERTSHPRPN